MQDINDFEFKIDFKNNNELLLDLLPFCSPIDEIGKVILCNITPKNPEVNLLLNQISSTKISKFRFEWNERK